MTQFVLPTSTMPELSELVTAKKIGLGFVLFGFVC